MRSHSPEMTMKLSSLATMSREKCSRNKRKFRQDPPCMSQSSSSSSSGGGAADESGNAGDGGESWSPATSSCADSSPPQKAGANGAGAKLGQGQGQGQGQRQQQQQLKLTRWFRAGALSKSAAARPGNLGLGKNPPPSCKAAAATDGSDDEQAEDEADEDEDKEEEEEGEDDEEEEEEEEEEVDWDDCTEGELEDILVQSVGAIYGEAIARIAARGGHSAEEARAAVLRCGHCPEGRDPVGAIVQTALACLGGGSKADWCRGPDSGFADMQALQKESLEEMLRRVRDASGERKGRGEAMWTLLMSDLNVKAACAADDAASAGLAKDLSGLAIQSGPSSTASASQSRTSAPSLCPDRSALSPGKSSAPTIPSGGGPLAAPDPGTGSDSGGESDDAPETPPNLANGKGAIDATADPGPPESEEIAASGQGPSAESDKNRRAITSDARDAPSPALSVAERVSGDPPLAEPPSKQSSAVNPKESVSEAVNGEEVVDSSESQSRAGPKDADARPESQQPSQQPSDPGFVGKSQSSSTDASQVDTSGTAPVPPQEPVSSPVRFGTVDESAIAMASERDVVNIHGCDSESSSSAEGTVANGAKAGKTLPDSPTKETSLTEKGELETEETIAKLRQRVAELETQVQKCTQWANQKVGQAAQRLHKDMQELKRLRLEREESLRLKKEKQAFEDSTSKKVLELESAKREAHGKADRVKALVLKLENENAEVRAEMQAAKLSAAEALSSCEEMAKRERKNSKRSQAWEKQKAKLQEELTEERRRIVALQQQVALAKERQQQAEVRWRQEEKAKEEATFRADYEKRAKEQAESASKKREDAMRRKAEANCQRFREDIQRLETEVGQIRISAEAAQLATSRWGPGVAVSPQIMELSSLQTLKESNNRLSREIQELQDMSRRDVRRERECVMCMCEEMSVVFLPCAHQVVCVKCNDLHEKQGMRDCPSCRTPIKQRIRVFGVTA